MSSWWKADGAMEALVVVIALLFILSFYCISVTHREAEDRYGLKNRAKNVSIILAVPGKPPIPRAQVPFALPVASAPPRPPPPPPPPPPSPPRPDSGARDREIEEAMRAFQTS